MDSLVFAFRNHRKEPSELEDDGEDSADDEAVFDEHPWLTNITGTVTDPTTSKVVARCFGQIIDRPQIRTDFHGQMDEPSQELQGLGWTLFDKKGYFKKDHYEHELKKGSGVFGEELGKGTMFIIEIVKVDKEWRRKGIATKLIQGVVKLAEDDGCIIAFAWPTNMNTRDLEAEVAQTDSTTAHAAIYDREKKTAIQVFRKLGFRRIGLTEYFCLPSLKDHKAHQLTIEEDIDPPKPALTSTDEMHSKFPIHSAIMSAKKEENCVKYLESLDETTDFTLKDDYQCSPLHLAASKSMPAVIKFLLSKKDVPFDLFEANIDGNTPLEVLEQRSQSDREFAEGMLHGWEGNSENWIQCKLLIEEAMGDSVDLKGGELQDARKQAKFSCKCGACVGGVMSKRMTFELLCQAEIKNDMFRDNIGALWDHVREDSATQMVHHFDELSYIPLHLQESTNHHKTFKLGFGKVFEHIAGCLSENKLPTISEISKYWLANPDWPPNTKTYLHKGGKFEYALDCILSNAESQNFIHGDGEHWRTFKDEIKQIPKCDTNDDNFKLMRHALLSPAAGATIVANGPHYPPNFWTLPNQTLGQKAENEKLHREMSEMFAKISPEDRRRIFGRSDDEEP